MVIRYPEFPITLQTGALGENRKNAERLGDGTKSQNMTMSLNCNPPKERDNEKLTA